MTARNIRLAVLVALVAALVAGFAVSAQGTSKCYDTEHRIVKQVKTAKGWQTAGENVAFD